MKVKELIEQLQELPQELPVILESYGEMTQSDVHIVQEDKLLGYSAIKYGERAVILQGD